MNNAIPPPVKTGGFLAALPMKIGCDNQFLEVLKYLVPYQNAETEVL